jgi:hypothetical protein
MSSKAETVSALMENLLQSKISVIICNLERKTKHFDKLIWLSGLAVIRGILYGIVEMGK